MPSKTFKVFIYEDELQYLKWLVLQRPDIETGGDLFGLWRKDHSVVVQLILGPGQNCARTKISFHQDVQYLEEVGQYLTSSHGLCNIGEWHSHHRIGLALPSSGDQDTVWQNMESVAGGRFLVFIANIKGSQNQPTVNVGSFMFVAASSEMRNGSLISLPGSSPLRLSLNDKHLKRGTEPGVDWRSFSVAREQTGGTLSNTEPEDRSFVTDDTDKRFRKSDLNEINHDSAKNPNLVATRETKLLPRKGRVDKSYGTLDNELSGKVPLKSGVKDTTHESQRKSNEVVTGKQTKLLSRNRKTDRITCDELNKDESSKVKGTKCNETKEKVITLQPKSSSPLRDLASPPPKHDEEAIPDRCCSFILPSMSRSTSDQMYVRTMK